MDTRGELIGELDMVLAALRRVIVRVIDLNKVEPAVRAAPVPPPIVRGPPPPAAAKAIRPPAPKAKDIPPVEANGVRIDFPSLTVIYRGKEVGVSRRQAQAVAVLARAIPHVIPRREICERAWPDLMPTSGDVTLSEMREPLTERLARIGLALKVVPKFGLALMPAEATA